MRIGLDVGGTHTDAVLIDGSGILRAEKVPTDHTNLMSSVTSALAAVLGTPPAAASEIHLSTTLTTNAILEGKTEPVGVLVSSGPGIHPRQHRIGDEYFVIDGALDHRGAERIPLDGKQLTSALAMCRDRGIRSYAVVGKFSPRNAAHEQIMAAALAEQADFVASGHLMGGRLNFPRRISSAYFNAAVWKPFSRFADAVEKGLRELGVRPSIAILKADGGTMPLARSRTMPVESILSGPAASIMGMTALCDIRGDAILLDIGGTSTDIAIVGAGVPLLVREGVGLDGRHTLVRGLLSRSIAIGGDSALRISKSGVSLGPDRCGSCMALGGAVPTLMDACNHTGLSELGDVEASRRGIRAIAHGLHSDADSVARVAVAQAVGAIASAANDLIQTVNDKPLYTVREVLHPQRIVPEEVYLVGGPAHALAGVLSEEFKLNVRVPEQHAVANAVGAAIARPTLALELLADTERGLKVIPLLSLSENIDSAYTLSRAQDEAGRALLHLSGEATAGDIDILEASSFNMIHGGRFAGRNIRVQCQLRPGLNDAYLAAVRRVT